MKKAVLIALVVALAVAVTGVGFLAAGLADSRQRESAESLRAARLQDSLSESRRASAELASEAARCAKYGDVVSRMSARDQDGLSGMIGTACTLKTDSTRWIVADVQYGGGPHSHYITLLLAGRDGAERREPLHMVTPEGQR